VGACWCAHGVNTPLATALAVIAANATVSFARYEVSRKGGGGFPSVHGGMMPCAIQDSTSDFAPMRSHACRLAVTSAATGPLIAGGVVCVVGVAVVGAGTVVLGGDWLATGVAGGEDVVVIGGC
jgi:hypothetical protein